MTKKRRITQPANAQVVTKIKLPDGRVDRVVGSFKSSSSYFTLDLPLPFPGLAADDAAWLRTVEWDAQRRRPGSPPRHTMLRPNLRSASAPTSAQTKHDVCAARSAASSGCQRLRGNDRFFFNEREDLRKWITVAEFRTFMYGVLSRPVL